MNSPVAVAGNCGPKVRSDCEMTLAIESDGGISITLSSKVESLYGSSIRQLASETLDFYGIKHASVSIIDSGALPFVISARLEAAVKKLTGDTRDYLPEFRNRDLPASKRERMRFSRLYLPGNTPSLMINAGLHSADGLILDLEDSVAPGKKDEARVLVRNALRQLDFYGAERMVRINQGETGIKDLEAVIPQNINLVVIPKCENAGQVLDVRSVISSVKKKSGIEGEVFLMPVIETAIGVENAFGISTSSQDVVAVAIGLEDYTADLGVQRTAEGLESFYARTRIINAARAAGIQPIDSVFSDIGDLDALKNNVKISKSLGFEGMGCIHPRQVEVIRQGFAPSADETEKAKKIILAFDEAVRCGSGVIAFGSKMIDAPVVARAHRTVSQAVSLGFLPVNWKEAEAGSL
ncbi:MAG TPA: aldolase/citrate lyase family protein [Bacteroidales bacterium]|jgi:citrate lyase subunit beta/citryl-CoA lyase|nr:aldolase/citrate lyase family protein [Bacteroidales bacterium]